MTLCDGATKCHYHVHSDIVMFRTVVTSTTRCTVYSSRLFSTSHRIFADPWPLPHTPQHLASTQTPPDISRPERIQRPNESIDTMRARLVYQSRKRGTLESDLLLSTFARDFLGDMSEEELYEYDKVSLSFFLKIRWNDYFLLHSFLMRRIGIFITGRRTNVNRLNVGLIRLYLRNLKCTRGMKEKSFAVCHHCSLY